MTARTITFTAQAPPTVGVPAYLSGKANYEWVAVAGAGKRQKDVQAPMPVYGNNKFDAWTGASIANDRREMLKVAGFGHGDGYDNSAYAINLGLDDPKWVRLNTPTTGAALTPYLTDTYTASGSSEYAAYGDGRGPAMHYWNEVQYLNGRVWFVGQTACYNWSTSPSSPVSWRRDLAEAGGAVEIGASDARYPLSYDAETTLGLNGTAGFWRGLGGSLPHSGGFRASCVFGNYVYGFTTTANNGRWWRINTTPGLADNARCTSYTGGIFNSVSWVVGCEDLGIIVARGNPASDVAQGNKILVLNVAANTWTMYDCAMPSVLDQDAFQPVYIAADKTLLFYSPRAMASPQILRLQIPTTGAAFNPAGAWNWTTAITPTGANPYVGVFDGGYTCGKFNKITNIGGGQAVLVCAPKWDVDTYVCKVPAP